MQQWQAMTYNEHPLRRHRDSLHENQTISFYFSSRVFFYRPSHTNRRRTASFHIHSIFFAPQYSNLYASIRVIVIFPRHLFFLAISLHNHPSLFLPLYRGSIVILAFRVVICCLCCFFFFCRLYCHSMMCVCVFDGCCFFYFYFFYI